MRESHRDAIALAAVALEESRLLLEQTESLSREPFIVGTRLAIQLQDASASILAAVYSVCETCRGGFFSKLEALRTLGEARNACNQLRDHLDRASHRRLMKPSSLVLVRERESIVSALLMALSVLLRTSARGTTQAASR
jgi:hypothetical protein